ncbi:MAG TPA: UDP-N-acetyl-D-mannosamine dehydrogenase [Acidimicrobiales bacterium]|nr:UDP-N-acetyl-D-mannosamine dehydrogenase [Acidimicrobiales bacterium]
MSMELPVSRVCVVGLGYIGLPTAAVLASHGYEVVGVDVNAAAVEVINQGRAHIVEPDLNAAVQGAVALGRLRAVTSPEPADAFIIAVPTPFGDGHQPDVSHVERAARSIAPHLVDGNLVILESTSPPGTTMALARWIAEERPDLVLPPRDDPSTGVSVSYCPERVLPGRILIELVTNDRVIGGLDPASGELARRLYASFVQSDCLLTDAASAEIVKLSENAFRDVNIAFANELSLICERNGVDVWDIIRLANRHPRVQILRPGPGVGGHCISVDPWFLVHSAPDLTPLIRTGREVNDSIPGYVVTRVTEALALVPELAGGRGTIACLGLTFKANIDDIRESPALEIVHSLAGRPDLDIVVVEPHLASLPSSLADLPNCTLDDLAPALDRADVAVLLVDHDEFLSRPDVGKSGRPVLVDTRGVWS